MMKRSSLNAKSKDTFAQLKLNFPLETFQSTIHAIAVKQDSHMTRVYTVLQPKNQN